MASPTRLVPEAVILGTALVVRVVWLVATRHLVLVNDPADYQRLAVSIAAGHGFGRTVVAPGGGPTAFRPPLWPLFLAGLYWLVGVHVMVARAVEVVLGTLSVGLVGVLGGQLWSRGPGRVAMGLATVYPPLLLAGGSLLSESLSLPLSWPRRPPPWPPGARPGRPGGSWAAASAAAWTSSAGPTVSWCWCPSVSWWRRPGGRPAGPPPGAGGPASWPGWPPRPRWWCWPA